MGSIIFMGLFGAFCGVGMLAVMASAAKNGTHQFDYVEFTSGDDVDATVSA